MKDPRIHRAAPATGPTAIRLDAAREENSHALAELATASGSSAR
jgi:hypothetical protein